MSTTSRDFRDYAAAARPTVKELYRLNHRYQTLDFVLQKKATYLSLDRRTTAESIHRADQPRWFIVTGLIHDLGKILCLWESRNGRLWATRSRSGAHFRIALSILSSSKPTPIVTTLCIHH